MVIRRIDPFTPFHEKGVGSRAFGGHPRERFRPIVPRGRRVLVGSTAAIAVLSSGYEIFGPFSDLEAANPQRGPSAPASACHVTISSLLTALDMGGRTRCGDKMTPWRFYPPAAAPVSPPQHRD
jgi:hypothetical protein